MHKDVQVRIIQIKLSSPIIIYILIVYIYEKVHGSIRYMFTSPSVGWLGTAVLQDAAVTCIGSGGAATFLNTGNDIYRYSAAASLWLLLNITGNDIYRYSAAASQHR